MFESMPRLGVDIQKAYLGRLGVAAEPPSVEGMHLLVQRHAERVPYETLWIHAGEAWNIDPYESATRIALQRRGGYCYHMNGALGLLLSSLGYAVRGHVGGVHGPEGPNAAAMGNHLVLTVEQLPSDTNPGGVWYVDAGLGDALHNPLPLVAGRHDQPPFQLSLEQAADKSQWHLTHDPSGGFTGMTWTMAHAHLTDFEAKHHWLSTSPESGFVQVAMAERRDATGVDVIRGLVLSRIGDGARTAEPVARRAEWFDLLADLFDLRLDTMTPQTRDRLWVNVLTAHRRWQASQATQNRA
ncbi:arylamine N-acetyltransferase family protein [Dactylosporangium sp. CA-233914]|uniref:arylamine N-acetyltransferase family protein n=1 Tax=Dactylosporangium sp. CA-233914 TaxID=3239934 RepID=UPI003D8A2FCF